MLYVKALHASGYITLSFRSSLTESYIVKANLIKGLKDKEYRLG